MFLLLSPKIDIQFTKFWGQKLIYYFLLLHQMTPLHLAAETARIKMLGYLVEQGAGINIQDDDGVIICDHTYGVLY